jgi:hypothetical protein
MSENAKKMIEKSTKQPYKIYSQNKTYFITK